MRTKEQQWLPTSASDSSIEANKLTRGQRGCVAMLVAVLAFVMIMYIPVWLADADARRNRARVNELISIGQNLDEAQQILRDSNFTLYYENPIKPTYDESYYQQLVIVGDTMPNPFETFAYAANLSWLPFTRSESPYVVINASLDGTITEID